LLPSFGPGEALLALSESLLGFPAQRDVVHRQENQVETVHATGVEYQDPAAERRELPLYLKTLKRMAARQNTLQQISKPGNVPATAAKRVNDLAFGVTRG
jgi:hypothetical protein